jgi:hypothetical protein
MSHVEQFITERTYLRNVTPKTIDWRPPTYILRFPSHLHGDERVYLPNSRAGG